MELKKVRPYTAKNGAQRYIPSLELIEEMMEEAQGFCIACGEVADGVEPDAQGYTCDCCGEPKVYGPEDLALRGFCF